MKASSKEGGAPPYASTTFGVFGYPTQRGKSMYINELPKSPDSQSLYPVTPQLTARGQRVITFSVLIRINMSPHSVLSVYFFKFQLKTKVRGSILRINLSLNTILSVENTKIPVSIIKSQKKYG